MFRIMCWEALRTFLSLSAEYEKGLSAGRRPRKRRAAHTLMKYVVGIDVKLNDVSALLVAEDGTIAASSTQTYDDIVTELGWSEQDPGDWWKATAASIRSVLALVNPNDVAAIGLAGQVHGLVGLDANNEVVRNAILLGDERSAAEYNTILTEGGVEAVAESDDRPFYTHFVQTKLLWLKENEPESFARIAKFVMPKDFIRYKLTGIVSANAADAERTGFFHTEDQEWDSQIVSNIGFDIVAFPPIAPSDAPCGTVTEQAWVETGLPVGLPVYGAAEDAVLESAGMSLVKKGSIGIVLDTSGIVATQTENIPSVSGGRLQSAVSFDGTKNMVYGTELSCIDSIRWVRHALFDEADDPMAACEMAASHAPAGAHGVVFLPYLMGERSPHIDPSAKAVFYGLSVLTKSRDLARAVMEGVVYGLHDIYDLICSANREVKCDEIVLSGIGCRYETLKHIVADVFGLRVKLYTGAAEGVAYGAALVAGTGENMFSSMEAAEAIHPVAEVIEPNKDNTAHYKECLRVYKELYADLRRTFDGK